MKSLLRGSSVAVTALAAGISLQAQPLVFDNSMVGHLVARATNSIAIDREVESFSFDALAGDVVSMAVDPPASALDLEVELRNLPL